VGRKEKQASAKGLAAFAGEHLVELGLERMQVQHVGSRIALLLLGQLRGAPIGGLLLL